MIDRSHDLSLTRQAKALAISRGSVYYESRPVSEEDLALMRIIDALHLECPFAGSRMLRDHLWVIYWAQRLRRVFNIDTTRCEACGGTMKVIASIEDPQVIRKIMAHLGLANAQYAVSMRPEPRASPRQWD